MRLFGLLQLSLGVVACYPGTDTLVSKPCASDRDCPDEFYRCIVTRVDGNKTCEVIFPPKPIEPSGTSSGAITYCKDIKPILDRTCVATCHGATTSGSGLSNFRLDFYVDPTGAIEGAKDRAARIKARTTVSKDMPPPSSAAPTEDERTLVGRWADEGAPQGDTNADACAQ